VLCSEPERAALRGILELGFVDSFRAFVDDPGHFSWWDYRQAAFRRNLGLRIDLILASETLRARLRAASIDRTPRTWERPSDHAPVVLDIDG
jgi:exodeoxyribonuclease-3